MKKIGIIGFSTASQSGKNDMFPDITIISLKTFVKENMYVRGSISLGDFFGEIMPGGVAPKTSQPSTGEILLAYKEMLQKYEDVLVIAPRKDLSGTYQNALLAKSMLETKSDNIHVVETNAAGMVETLCTEYAITLIHKNVPIKKIKADVEKLGSKITTYVFPGSIKFLKMSGRVSGVRAFVGEFLNMKTAVKVTDEFVKIDHKGRGEKSCLKYLDSQIKLLNPTCAYISDIRSDKEFLESAVALLEKNNVRVTFTKEADIVTGAHFGPNSFGIGWFNEGDI